MGETPIIRFEGISKRFPGVAALTDLTFEIREGSCHALCGENGAGKSTLGKILAGVHVPDGGRLFLAGQAMHFRDPRDAFDAGVAMVHQERAFCPNLSVAENLCLGRLPSRGFLVKKDDMRRRAQQILDNVGVSLDVARPAGSLSIGHQQMVQIAAAVGTGARVIVFDEPTSSLGEHEAAQLYRLMGHLRERGVTCLYVSHRLAEIFRLCDSVTVLRDGRHVATQEVTTLGEGTLVQMMIGRRLQEYFPEHLQRELGPELLRVEGLSTPERFHDIAFSLRAGEVLGLAGLVGAGRSELAQALFGLDPDATGGVSVDGRPVRIRTPAAAMDLGLGLVPEDRQRQGLVLALSGLANTTLPFLKRLARLNWIRHRAERALVQDYFTRLRVRTLHLNFPAAGLSGGNQQKIVLAKWLAARCRILMLDEPTRGVDVGAKAEIHALVDRLAAEGNGVLLISSELPELLALSTRILVLRAGRLAGEVAREQATEEALMRLMAGVSTEALGPNVAATAPARGAP